jgi:hypothetical protein
MMAAVEVSFEQSMRETDRLIKDVMNGEVDGEAAGKTICKLVSTMSGARGFLVSFLTGGSKLSDDPPSYIVDALKSAPSVVCDLLAKNLVMSSTMALTHRRNADADNEQGSLSVERRTTKIVQMMDTPEMSARLQDMWDSVTEQKGSYNDFLARWKYDEEQLGCARRALGVAMGAKP